jgi:hypothetical protein
MASALEQHGIGAQRLNYLGFSYGTVVGGLRQPIPR